ncbi:leucyl/phenylalanyl-tRNA--protein transferase [Synechococcus moorigangaii CMS01]|nr:leucyl/phenylalanyl-tRNA--protein transferase [Synechococcus moorigangaii CMS01]
MLSRFNLPSILEGYSQGYFLMADEQNHLGWYSSRQRTLMPLDDRFRYPKSLRRSLNQNIFTPTINQAFEAVCTGCADRDVTWISPELLDIYRALHRAGWAHSFETWRGDQLAGGILGVAIGGAFIGESMFFQIPNGSKVAMVLLVEHLRRQGFILFDVQLQNPHLERFGSYVIDSQAYRQLLAQAVRLPCRFAPEERDQMSFYNKN